MRYEKKLAHSQSNEGGPKSRGTVKINKGHFNELSNNKKDVNPRSKSSEGKN